MSQDHQHNRDFAPAPHERGWGLTYPTWSLTLAFLLGFSPVGADILHLAYTSREPVAYVSISLLFVIIMLIPLALLYRVGGLNGFFGAPVRVALSMMLIAFRLAVDLRLVCEMMP